MRRGLHHLARSVRAHGWTRDLPADSEIFEKRADDFFEAYRFILPGYNARPLELSGAVGVEQYNVGLSDANLSKWELCERIQQQLPKFVFLESQVGKDPDQRDYIVSNEKIENTGFKPCFSLDAGIAELIKGYAMIRNTRYTNV